MSAQPIQVTTAIDSEERAQALTKTIVEERLAACGQIEGPVQSTYVWKDKLEQSVEYRCVFKTDMRLWNDIARRITELHNYDVPEIVASEYVCVSDSYSHWMQDQLER